ncbi:MAG: hypothetical protein ACREJD_11985 [Phycisphaerales bacterium]
MPEQSASNMNTLRLVCFALCAGMIVFAIIAIVTTIEQVSPASHGQSGTVAAILPSIAVALGVGIALIWPLVHASAVRSARIAWRGPGEVAEKERALWSRYSALVVCRAALVEAFGLFGIVTLFLAGAWWGLAAPAMAIGVVLYLLPSQAKYEQFLSRATEQA